MTNEDGFADVLAFSDVDFMSELFLGIDPGFARTGFSVLKLDSAGNLFVEDAGLIKTSVSLSFPKRLLEIEDNLQEILNLFNFSSAAVESLFFSNNQKTAINVAHARGVILRTIARSNIAIYEYTPPQIKKALTGRGRANKLEVQGMVSRILNLQTNIVQDDVADAVAVAMCHCRVFEETRCTTI